jgi:GNAT superfamily N-acetyltransferase
MENPVARLAITIGELDATEPDEVADFYRLILASNFPDDELETIEGFTVGLNSGGTFALVARTSEGMIAGGAVGDLFPRSNVVLLSYLAVPPAGRGSGTGGLLMRAVTEVWGGRLNPSLFLMEVEDPRYHYDDANFGDPQARVRFYERLGARALPVPYFQPALGSRGSSARRVPHLMLMAFGGTQMPPGTQGVDGSIVELFLTEYLEGCEGPVRPQDADAQRLLAACRRSAGLPLLRVSELPRFD